MKHVDRPVPPLPLAALVATLAVSCSMPPEHLEFPELRGWSSVTVLKEGGEARLSIEKRFVTDGPRYRLEVHSAQGDGMIAVYDGERLVTTSADRDFGASQLDPRSVYRSLYAELETFRYVGPDRVDGRSCWRFVTTRGELEQELWIDVESHAPRRNFVRKGDTVIDEQFFDLPVDFEISPALFDTEHLAEQIRQQALGEDRS